MLSIFLLLKLFYLSETLKIDESFTFIDCHDGKHDKTWFENHFDLENSTKDCSYSLLSMNLKLHIEGSVLKSAEDLNCLDSYYTSTKLAYNEAGELMNYIWSLAERRVKNMLVNLFFNDFEFEDCPKAPQKYTKNLGNREDFIDYFLLSAVEPIEVKIISAEIHGNNNLYFFSPVTMREDSAIFYWAKKDGKKFRIFRAKRFYCDGFGE
ncbi:unnamed protein product [Caenorhabditis angaria]|uniref:Uncharacterized protein n=1 Tax=Caenorhabditis angaria TaxID=860376 RepID=A0A9P1N709_9PELO|nr:unnamed protein product [Caenorhabditis angaria]